MVFLDQNKIEEGYRKENTLWGFQPNLYVAKLPDLLNGGHALDVGAGEGRNALFLAEKGFHVTAVDISQVAIDKLVRFASERGIELETVVADILTYEITRVYDAMISTVTLHFIPESETKTLIQRMKDSTQDGGVHVITAFSKRDIGAQETPHLHFFDDDELREHYRDWVILLFDRYQKYETHDKPHAHDILALIARKG